MVFFFFFLISQPNLSWGYSKQLSEWDNSLEHQKYIFEVLDKKITQILHGKVMFTRTSAKQL